MKVNIYIGFGTLEMKCTQYEICEEVAFKIARAKVFFESHAGQAEVSGRIQNIPVSLWAVAPACIYLPPKARWG
jgi:hypothetical protein